MVVLAYILWGIVALVAALVLIVGGLVAAVLASPARLKASGEVRRARPKLGAFELSALFGGVGIWRAPGARPAWRFTLLWWSWPRGRREPKQPEAGPQKASKTPRAKKAPKPERDEVEQKREDRGEKERRPKKPRDGRFWIDLTRQGLLQQWIGPAARAIGELLSAPTCERARANLRFGTGDPAETGMLCGALWAFTGPLSAARSVAVELEPDFMDARLDGDGEIALSVRPGAVVVTAARLLWRGPVWRTYEVYRAAKRRRRKTQSN